MIKSADRLLNKDLPICQFLVAFDICCNVMWSSIQREFKTSYLVLISGLIFNS